MQDDDTTVLKLTRKSTAMAALSYLETAAPLPAKLDEVYGDALIDRTHPERLPLYLAAILGITSLIPVLFQPFDILASHVGLTVLLVGVAALPWHVARRPKYRSERSRLYLTSAAVSAAFSVVVFWPLTFVSEGLAVGLFVAWLAALYLAPAQAVRERAWVAWGASLGFFGFSAGVFLLDPRLPLAEAGLMLALATVALVLMNVLGQRLSGQVQRLRVWNHVLQHLRELLQDEVQSLSDEDDLTGVESRKRMLEVLEQHWDQAQRNPAKAVNLSLLLVDVDHLEQLNAHYGRHIGDVCLKRVAALLRTHVKRRTDHIARFSGNGFLLCLFGTDERQAVRLAHDIRASVENLNMLNPGSPNGWVVTVSAGVCGCLPRPGYLYADAIGDVKYALGRAKTAGRNAVVSREGLETSPGKAHAGAERTLILHKNPKLTAS